MSDKFDALVNSRFSIFMNFLYKIMIINLLYLFTLLIGLFFFTFSAASISTYVCMKGLNEQKEFPIVKTYFTIFKQEYRNAILFTLYYMFTFSILGISFYYYLHTEDLFFNTIGMVVVGFLIAVNLASYIHILLISIYTPSIKLRSKIKYSYLMQLYKPVLTILLLVMNGLLILFAYTFITFSFMFTFAFMAYYNISISKRAYLKVSNDYIPLDVLSL